LAALKALEAQRGGSEEGVVTQDELVELGRLD